LDTLFGEELFTAHVYPLASIAKNHSIVFLKDYTVAVRATSSQTRHKSSIYEDSPAESWARMFETFYEEEQYEKAKRAGIKQVGTHYLGLVQIRNYGAFRNLLHEILVLIKLHPLNLLSCRFWLYVLGVVVIPRGVLIWLVDSYKTRVLAKWLCLKMQTKVTE